ncbi:MAG: hypothetical protein EOP21_14770 [Hyphomicrobiales bacterium]|nr:MAG: hypothetical protein EOP21_14770 [Hyphomicrobiales bacterium]
MDGVDQQEPAVHRYIDAQRSRRQRYKVGKQRYLDIAIAIALVGFLSTVALARYLLARTGGEPR